MDDWQLIFCSFDTVEVQIISVAGDPQEQAITCLQENEWLRGFYLAAAVKGQPEIKVADNARTAECGLQG